MYDHSPAPLTFLLFFQSMPFILWALSPSLEAKFSPLGMEESDESRTRRDEQRSKYSKMDKRAEDKLVKSPTENGGG